MSVERKQAGSSIALRINVYNQTVDPAVLYAPSGGALVTITGPDGVDVVTLGAMSTSTAGVYTYLYQSATSATLGDYVVKYKTVDVTVGTHYEPATVGFILVNEAGTFPSTPSVLTGINADYLLGSTWASPGAIGSTTPNSGVFTTIAMNSLALGGSLTSGSLLSITGGSDWTILNPTRTINYITFAEASPVTVAAGVNILQTWTTSGADGAALVVQTVLDTAATSPVSPAAIWGGIRNYKAGADVFGIGAFINNDTTNATPSGRALYIIARNKGGGSVFGAQAISETSSGTNPGAAYTVGNSAAGNAWLTGAWVSSYAVNGVLVGGASGAAVTVGVRPYTFQDTAANDLWYVNSSGVMNTSQALAANTAGDGVVLVNSAAATAGNQRYSPSIRFTGKGWKTDATAASQTVDWTISARPVEGTAAPAVTLVWASQVNAGGYTDRLMLTSAGGLTATTLGSTSGATLQFGGAAPSGFFNDATNISIRAIATGGIYFQEGSGGTTRGLWDGTGLHIGGAAAAGFRLDVTGDANVSGVFRQAGTAGLTIVKTVRNSGGAADCTMTFAGGILTASTCA